VLFRSVRRDLSHGVRRLRVLPVSQRRILAAVVFARAGGIPLRLQSAGTNHLQSVSETRALRTAGGQRERSVSGRTDAAGDVSEAARSVSRKDGAADFRIRRLRTPELRGAGGFS